MLSGLYVLFCSAFLPVVTIATLGILCALLELIGEDKAKNYSFKDWIDTLLERHTRPPSEPQSLQTTPLLFGIRLDWDFANPTDILLKTEIGYNKSGEDDDTLQFADIAYPQRTHTLQGLAAGEKLYFRARLVDKSGHASAWTSLVSGHASTDTGWIVEASRDHFLDAETGRRLQEQLAEQARVDARHKQSAAENAQAIERLNDMLKDLQQRTR